ncbi:MAG: methylated-DNA--[protein]-cysteine S-methyltransferase [Leptospiraceae bacterium]|nr:methylated-DNA--[protein]-cysteine S-methyltransferase [Leptospiraceae bacterium]MCP5512308.1 methylated-DNA--[protein]-cysteine S-methyltransferase [Leptospiraceae bacterium]
MEENFYQKVYSIVKKIPRGNVSTYGRIAVLVGVPRAARAVGYALNQLKKSEETEIPWQRVINSRGRISFGGDPVRATLQRKLLEHEGIPFQNDGQIDLKQYGWPDNEN